MCCVRHTGRTARNGKTATSSSPLQAAVGVQVNSRRGHSENPQNFKRECMHRPSYRDTPTLSCGVPTLTAQMSFSVINVVTTSPKPSVLQARSPFYTLSQADSSVSAAEYRQLVCNWTEPFTPCSSRMSSRGSGLSRTHVVFRRGRSSCHRPVSGATSMASHGHLVPMFREALISLNSRWNAVGAAANAQEILIDFENLLGGLHPRMLPAIHVK